MLWILGAPAILIGLLVAGVIWMTAVPGRSHTGPLPPLTPDQVQLAARLQEHVRAVASRPHNLSHPHELERAALYLESTLVGMGYEVHRQPFRADSAEVRNIGSKYRGCGRARRICSRRQNAGGWRPLRQLRPCSGRER